MALFDLNRANDTPIATLKLAEIVPKNWPTLPAVQPAPTPIHVPVITYTGGASGDDVDQATANATNDYAPKTQAAKATATGNTLAVDIARARGSIAPGQPYPKTGDAAPAAPVVSSIAPTTGAAATLPLTVTITGTGFSPWSTVYTGGMTTPDTSAKYISPTQMKVALWAAAPGTVSVAVEDHNVLSNTNVLFTVT